MMGEIHDPVASLREVLRTFLARQGSATLIEDAALAPGLHWSPHLYDKTTLRAWHCLTDNPPSDRWATRMEAVLAELPRVGLGVCGPMHVLKEEEILSLVDRLGAAVCVVDESNSDSTVYYSTACDFIYGENLQLSHRVAAEILDRSLERCLAAVEAWRKGVLLELLTAVLLSQVLGFEVITRDISNRTQQIDVLVHNRNTSGVLRSGEIVVAEAKNWSSPVGTTEYYAFFRKLEDRHGRAKLGFFVTTDRFTTGVELERRRDSKGEVLVVLLDHESLPRIWRTGSNITQNIEKAVLDAALGE